MREKGLSRRSFLRLLGAGAGLAIAGLGLGCGPEAEKRPTPAVVGTSVAEEKKKEVKEVGATPGAGGLDLYFLTAAWYAQSMGITYATQKFNQKNAGKVRVTVEDTGTGWETKVLAMSRAKELRWSGGFSNTVSSSKDQYVRSGMIMPLDDLIKGSSVAFVSKMTSDIPKSMVGEISRDGKIYFWPSHFSPSGMIFFVSQLKAVGYDTFPETWDEFTLMLRKLKDNYKKQGKDDMIPCLKPELAREELCGMHETFAVGMSDKVFTDEGIRNIKGPAFQELMKMIKGWVDEKFSQMEPKGDLYRMGKCAVFGDYANELSKARAIFGMNEVMPGNAPFPKVKKADPTVTSYFVNAACIYTNAPHAQEAFDYVATCLNPETEEGLLHHAGVLSFTTPPCYISYYPNYIDKTPGLLWMRRQFDAAANASVWPANGIRSVERVVLGPWLDKFYAGQVSAKEMGDKAYDQMRDELATASKAFEEQLKKAETEKK